MIFNIILFALLTISGWRYSTYQKNYKIKEISPITIIVFVVTSATIGYEFGTLLTQNKELCSFFSYFGVTITHLFWYEVSIIRECIDIIK